MSRTEDLSTKLRTLSYEHERLVQIHATSCSLLASTERDASTLQTKFHNLSRTLQNTEASHKQTMSELQRLRGALKDVRAVHLTELKKKEREMDRMAERWSKISDMQTRISTSRSGLRCANLADGVPHTKGVDHVELALQESESTCGLLRTSNQRLKELVLDTTNSLQSLACDAKCLLKRGDAQASVIFSGPVSADHMPAIVVH